MAVDIASAFDHFIVSLRTTRTESAAAASHRASIKAKLDQEFSIATFFRTGSFGSGTNVSGFSDVDYFAVVPRANLKGDSGATLAQLARTMRERFPTTPNIRINGPAVQIPFGLDGAEHTEVIPVDAMGLTRLGFREFEMPDGNGGWMFSAPESHKAFVDHHDQRLQGRLKPLIQCIKAWKFYRAVPVRSFYLEMFVTNCMLGEASIVYPIDLQTIFRRLYQSQFADIIDPRFNAMTLSGCSTASQRVECLSKCLTAWTWAAEAYEANNCGRTATAFERWNLVFNYNFPPYTRALGLGFMGR